MKWQQRIRHQSLMEKAELYRVINRRGRLKEEVWSALRMDVERRWRKGKKKKDKDLTPDRTTESLFEELVVNGIIKCYPKVNHNY